MIGPIGQFFVMDFRVAESLIAFASLILLLVCSSVTKAESRSTGFDLIKSSGIALRAVLRFQTLYLVAVTTHSRRIFLSFGLVFVCISDFFRVLVE
jgi:hypothetical protein